MKENIKSTLGCLTILVVFAAIVYGLITLYSLFMQERMIVKIREMSSDYERLVKYEEYLKEYPKGRYAHEAENFILSNLDYTTRDDEYYYILLDDALDEYRGTPFAARIDSLLDSRISRDYNKAEQLGTIAGWEEYKSKLPEKYWRNADNKIAELERILWGTEDAAWQSAQDENTADSYGKYLKLYPEGEHVKAADKKYIDLSVAEAFSNKHYDLPEMNKKYYNASNRNEVVAKNKTEYTLTIMYSGPVNSYRQVIDAKETGKIVMTNGDYRIVAFVDTPTVVPYAGTMTLNGGGYESEYFIL